MPRALLLLTMTALAASACTLRPRYAQLISPKVPGPDVLLQVTDASSGAPLAGVRVEVGEGARRLSAITDPDGTFSVPVDDKRRAENPLIVVELPQGVRSYAVRLSPGTPAGPPIEHPVPPPPPQE